MVLHSRTRTRRSHVGNVIVLVCAFAVTSSNGRDGSSLIVADAAGNFSPILRTVKDMDYRYFVAGGVCAAASHGITTPVDVVKTRMQAEPEKFDRGVAKAALAIIKSSGPASLLGGLGPTVAGYGLEGAMKFGVYEVMKPVVLSVMKGSKAAAYLIASIVAGAIASILLCPMESTRIRIVTDPEYADMGLFTGLPKLVREEGLMSTFGGLYAMLAKQVPYTMAKQVSFDVVAKMLYAATEKVALKAEELNFVISLCAAFVASILACIFSQPGDMILTETYKGKSDKGVWGIVSDIYKTKGGVSGFFVGTGARIIHVGMIITSQLVIYDFVKQLLGLPATGAH